MRVHLVTVGHRQPAWVDAAFADYARRLSQEVRLELVSLKPETRPATAGEAAIAKLLAREAQRITAAIPAGALIVALDERGKAVTTRDLATQLERWLAGGRDVALVVGSADGLDAGLKSRADMTLSLSALTLPHGLVRVLIAEQLYRALSLLKGHPYHRD
ncbi:MAG: 23S rRNA (pseudouridine(1915)-N(3))-methyltransferase RlmH [Betaproteobacteria bacterium]|nr:23S rRNA (pseudouridine(1915)-N(3))-methyltransferase RlmH [Betaproteobacteria bacterium]